MRKWIIAAAALAIVAAPAAAWAGSSAPSGSKASLNPPARPVALTPAQYQTLRVIEQMPEHSKVGGSVASYSAREKNLQFTRFSDDFWTVAYDVGWPGTYLAFIICAL
jgi:hypothetical protein